MPEYRKILVSEGSVEIDDDEEDELEEVKSPKSRA